MSRPHVNEPGLWPREHGAYVQLLAPMLAALLFVRPSAAALAFACLACALFLLHEPVLLMLGRRGRRAKEALAARAKQRIFVLSALVVLSFSAGVWLAPALTPWLILPLSLSLVCAALLFQKRERTVVGQLAVSMALTSFALPPMLASSVPVLRALSFVGAFASVQAMSALTARGFVYRKQDDGKLLGWSMAGALLTVLLFATLCWWDAWPLSWSLAPLPFALVTAALVAGIFKPRSPKPVGWALAGASALSVILFGLGLAAL